MNRPGALSAEVPAQRAGVFGLLLNPRRADASGIALPRAMPLRAGEVVG